MAAGFSVVVRGSHWPTMQALQECLDRHRWPVKLGDSTHPRWSEPLDTVPYTLGIPVVFKGEPIELEAEIAILDYTNMSDINRQLSVFGATHVVPENGDRVLTVWLRVNIKEHQAAFYVMAALIKDFDGYGLGEGGGHGTSGYADSLLAEANRLEVEGPRQPTPQEMKEATRNIVDFFRKTAEQSRKRN
jgi:hypothetical protein